ncbi:SO2930 family diheme c-type cytochrome [Pseudolysobacter antarcticus]|nr:SO2930 family diheme c-type cytochrome [Pseudolysobacter antarcticus]
MSEEKMQHAARFCVNTAAAFVLAAALVACSQAPAPVVPVTFHASGSPAHLSDWHVTAALDGKLQLNADVVPYDLNTPLFSDYAHKLRTIWMPKGVAAKYDAAQTFDFPVGTIITKTFYYPLPKGAARDAKSVARSYDQSRDFAGSGLDLTQVHLIETRVLVRRESGWAALPYVWNADQTDAELARTGDTQALELVADDGTREPFTYVVPNENQCAGCHGTDMKNPSLIAPIGPKARHLNRDYAYADGRENQLAHLTRLGYLMGLPEASAVPRNADWHDATQDVTARARAYLDINCGHCHNANGPANTTGLSLDIFTAPDRHLGLCKPPVAAGRGTGDHKVDIVPGKPDDSILPYRMNSSEPAVMMPEQGRSTIHREGMELIRAWIAAWQGNCDVAS